MPSPDFLGVAVAGFTLGNADGTSEPATLTITVTERSDPSDDPEVDGLARAQVQVVAMDGFGGYKNAANEALPDAVTVMDPFHVVALAGAKLDLCRQRIQQATLGHRGRTGDPLYRVRRTLRTRLGLLTDRQRGRLKRYSPPTTTSRSRSPGGRINRSSLPTLIQTHNAARRCSPR